MCSFVFATTEPASRLLAIKVAYKITKKSSLLLFIISSIVILIIIIISFY